MERRRGVAIHSSAWLAHTVTACTIQAGRRVDHMHWERLFFACLACAQERAQHCVGVVHLTSWSPGLAHGKMPRAQMGAK